MLDALTRGLKKNLKHLWGVFYVMTESVEKENLGRWPIIKGVLLLYVDAAQVMRVLTQQGYGWSDNIFNVTRYFDVFKVAQDATGSMLSKVVSDGEIPSYLFFMFSSGLVLLAVGDVVYVMKLFAAGHVEKMWPVKMLIVLVDAMVSTGFSTIFGWMLIPIRCLVSPNTGYKSMSYHIRGRNADDSIPCFPWIWPEVVISVPSCVLISMYMWFAMVSSLLSFALNPLSRQPRATCSGRVEFYYSIMQFMSAFGIYFTGLTSPIATNCIISVCFGVLFRYHRDFLPFNSHLMNCVRGGFLLCFCWVPGMSTLLLSWMLSQGKDVKDIESTSMEQIIMWIIMGMVPVIFAVGCVLIHWKRKGLYEIMINLYGEYLQDCRAQYLEITKEMSNDDGNWGDKKTQRSFMTTTTTEPGAYKMAKKSQHEAFFDPASESKIVFRSWLQCHAAARTFLFRRDDLDLKFLNYIIKKGLSEHPGSDELVILHIQMLRFVFRNPMQAAAQEKIFRVGGKVSAYDNQYTLYAMERKLFQERACSDLGQDAVRAIDLMEFNLGMQTARAAHLSAISNIKQFWRLLSKRTHKSHFADELMQRLEKYDLASQKAKQEYMWMLDKYSNSAQLLREWAQFCDHIMNDERGAIESRLHAVSLENQINEVRGGNESEQIPLEENNSDRGGKAQSQAASSLSETTESKRVTIQRFFSKIAPCILQSELSKLGRFHRQVQLFVLCLVMIESVAFVFAVVFVFSDVATLDIHMIAFISLFRSHVATCGFFQRSSMIAAWQKDSELLKFRAQRIVDLSRQVEVEHWNLYQAAEGGMKNHLDSIKFSVQIPTDKGWVQDDFVYFDLIFDYVRRIRSSSKCTMEDFSSPDFSLGKISEAKSEVAYVQENIFRSVTEVFESLLQLYDQQLEAFIGLATSLVIVISSLTALIVIVFGFFLMKGMLGTIQTVQYKLVICSMGFTLPRTTAKKMYKHYQLIEYMMKSMEDEELERRGPAVNDFDEEFLHEAAPAPGSKREPSISGSTRHHHHSGHHHNRSDDGDENGESDHHHDSHHRHSAGGKDTLTGMHGGDANAEGLDHDGLILRALEKQEADMDVGCSKNDIQKIWSMPDNAPEGAAAGRGEEHLSSMMENFQEPRQLRRTESFEYSTAIGDDEIETQPLTEDAVRYHTTRWPDPDSKAGKTAAEHQKSLNDLVKVWIDTGKCACSEKKSKSRSVHKSSRHLGSQPLPLPPQVLSPALHPYHYPIDPLAHIGTYPHPLVNYAFPSIPFDGHPLSAYRASSPFLAHPDVTAYRASSPFLAHPDVTADVLYATPSPDGLRHPLQPPGQYLPAYPTLLPNNGQHSPKTFQSQAAFNRVQRAQQQQNFAGYNASIDLPMAGYRASSPVSQTASTKLKSALKQRPTISKPASKPVSSDASSGETKKAGVPKKPQKKRSAALEIQQLRSILTDIDIQDTPNRMTKVAAANAKMKRDAETETRRGKKSATFEDASHVALHGDEPGSDARAGAVRRVNFSAGGVATCATPAAPEETVQQAAKYTGEPKWKGGSPPPRSLMAMTNANSSPGTGEDEELEDIEFGIWQNTAYMLHAQQAQQGYMGTWGMMAPHQNAAMAGGYAVQPRSSLSNSDVTTQSSQSQQSSAEEEHESSAGEGSGSSGVSSGSGSSSSSSNTSSSSRGVSSGGAGGEQKAREEKERGEGEKVPEMDSKKQGGEEGAGKSSNETKQKSLRKKDGAKKGVEGQLDLHAQIWRKDDTPVGTDDSGDLGQEVDLLINRSDSLCTDEADAEVEAILSPRVGKDVGSDKGSGVRLTSPPMTLTRQNSPPYDLPLSTSFNRSGDNFQEAADELPDGESSFSGRGSIRIAAQAVEILPAEGRSKEEGNEEDADRKDDKAPESDAGEIGESAAARSATVCEDQKVGGTETKGLAAPAEGRVRETPEERAARKVAEKQKRRLDRKAAEQKALDGEGDGADADVKEGSRLRHQSSTRASKDERISRSTNEKLRSFELIRSGDLKPGETSKTPTKSLRDGAKNTIKRFFGINSASEADDVAATDEEDVVDISLHTRSNSQKSQARSTNSLKQLTTAASKADTQHDLEMLKNLTSSGYVQERHETATSADTCALERRQSSESIETDGAVIMSPDHSGAHHRRLLLPLEVQKDRKAQLSSEAFIDSFKTDEICRSTSLHSDLNIEEFDTKAHLETNNTFEAVRKGNQTPFSSVCQGEGRNNLHTEENKASPAVEETKSLDIEDKPLVVSANQLAGNGVEQGNASDLQSLAPSMESGASKIRLKMRSSSICRQLLGTTGLGSDDDDDDDDDDIEDATKRATERRLAEKELSREKDKELRTARQTEMQSMLNKKDAVKEVKAKGNILTRLFSRTNIGQKYGHEQLNKVVDKLLPETLSNEDMRGALVQAVVDRRVWHQSFNVYMFAILSILVLSVFCAIYPVEKVATFVNSASTLNHASRRRYLVKNIVHLTREMVLNDGFSRFDINQITSAIAYYQDQFRRSDEAVRKGGVFGIRTGADDHNEEHNMIMYTKGCPWRNDTSNCTIPSLPGMGESGLYQILSAFNDAVRKAMVRYGAPQSDWPVDWKGESGLAEKFKNVTLNFDRLAKIEEDNKLAFIMDSFEGDVSQGLTLISDILEKEAFQNLQNGVRDNNTLYTIHIVSVIVVFYCMLFRHTMWKAQAEIKKTRFFIMLMPFYILPPQDVEIVVDFFKKEQHFEPEDEVEEDEVNAEQQPTSGGQLETELNGDSQPKSRVKSYTKLINNLGGIPKIDEVVTPSPGWSMKKTNSANGASVDSAMTSHTHQPGSPMTGTRAMSGHVSRRLSTTALHPVGLTQ